MNRFISLTAILMLAVIFLGLIAAGKLIQKPSPVTIIKTDYDSMIVYVRLHKSLVTGTDSACYAAALIINAICEQGWKVYIMNEWVPSAVNPIDVYYSRMLVELQGKPFPLEKEKG